uniref:Endonuclease/exonuclease/phosphatase domain-containing protein n=1 Tax=Octopus bimaculoides TaxID=37653 RepID=A0A0L8IHE4_OCTBM
MLIFGCWNVRILQDNKCHIEREIALTAKVTSLHNIDIGPLGKIRHADTGELEVGSAADKHLLTFRIPIGNSSFMHLISAYATTLSAFEQEYNIFYSKLQIVISKSLYHDKVVLMFCLCVMGKYRTGKMNASSKFCLIITNTISQHADKYKNFWKYPRSSNWHMCDCIISKSKDCSDVSLTRAHKTPECYSDHRMVRSKVKPCTKLNHTQRGH